LILSLFVGVDAAEEFGLVLHGGRRARPNPHVFPPNS